MKIGYCRVSTPDQKLDAQLDALHGAGCERIFQDVMSSTRQDRHGLAEAVSHLRRGDVLVVTKLDRLGRSVKGLIALTEQLKADEVGFQSLSDTIDTTTPMGQFFFTLMAACAELERNLIVERTKTGLAAARARGRVGGRPRKVTRNTLRIAMAALADPKNTAREVAKLIGIHRTVLYRYIHGDGTLTPRGQSLLGARAGELAEAAD